MIRFQRSKVNRHDPKLFVNCQNCSSLSGIRDPPGPVGRVFRLATIDRNGHAVWAKHARAVWIEYVQAIKKLRRALTCLSLGAAYPPGNRIWLRCFGRSRTADLGTADAHAEARRRLPSAGCNTACRCQERRHKDSGRQHLCRREGQAACVSGLIKSRIPTFDRP
jgi:hypothetical protein